MTVHLEPNATLGPYRIIAPLGAGGMGEVYRARDDKLERDVAVKVLPARLAADPDALERFEREAKAVAALSHPNILAIHDFGIEGACRYAVMELLEGQSLRALLADGPLSPRKAVDYGRQIAAGMAAAHDRGIAHRDLKPENLFLTRDGLMKILDFGLATPGPTEPKGSASNAPTQTHGTRPGTVIGTIGYMAPEQVRGEPADYRADIFAFGAVLHEMLAGRRAFERATGAETMTATLREEAPALSTLRADVPPALERVVAHCLEKRAEDRFQSARDLAFALSEATGISGAASGVGGGALAGRPRVAVGYLALAAVLLLGLATGGLLSRWLAPAPAGPDAPRVRYLTYSGRDYSPDASPDGRAVAFRSDRDGRARIWVKQLPTGVEVALTDGPFDDLPHFSPDGSMVLFTRWTGALPSLYRVPILGGEPRRVADDALDAAWSPDGERIAFLRPHAPAAGRAVATSLMLAADDGSAATELARLESAFVLAPRWSPDGREIALTTSGVVPGTVAIVVVALDGGARRVVVESEQASRPMAALWAEPGWFVFSSGQVAPGRTSGAAGRLNTVARDTGEASVLYASPDSIGRLTGLGSGRFVLESQAFRQNVMEWSPEGEQRRLSHGRAADRQPAYAPDGEWLVFTSDRAGNLDLWAIATRTGVLRQLTDDPADDWDPAFAPDGRLYWSSNRSGNFEVWTAAADGSGARQLTLDGVDAENPAVSPDGRWVVYGSTRPDAPGVWKIRSDGAEAALLVPGRIGIPRFSPDGRHLLYAGFGANLLGTSVQVARFADGQPVEFSIDVKTVRPTSANLGRAHWLGNERIAFIGQDQAGAHGVFVQDFAPGRDTSSTRRKLAGFDPDVVAESFALSPDARHVAISSRETVSSLVLLEGLAPR